MELWRTCGRDTSRQVNLCHNDVGSEARKKKTRTTLTKIVSKFREVKRNTFGFEKRKETLSGLR